MRDRPTRRRLPIDNASSAQEWTITDTGSGYYKLLPQCAPTKCLNCKGAGSTNGTLVTIFDDNGSDAQRWKLEQQ